jgi:tetratricopeptide (TPR) repeat protein
LKIDENDIITRQTLALFYKEIGMFKEADNEFKKTLEIDSEHIPSINAYALFLKQLAKFEWVRDPKKSKEYIDNAEEQFNSALLKFSEFKDVENNPQYQRIEMQLKNSYANFLQSKTEWYSSYTERIEIDTKVEEVFEEILNKYPEHGHSVNNYAHFLINKAKILPKYRRNIDNLIKAETMLSEFITKERSKKSLSFYMALHLLGRYLYTIKAGAL